MNLQGAERQNGGFLDAEPRQIVQSMVYKWRFTLSPSARRIGLPAHPEGPMKLVAIYLRVSSTGQDTKSQEPDLQRWADAQDGPVKWFKDTATGKNMDRPGWQKLETASRKGLVSAVVVWRIDRLGRTAKGLTSLFEDLR